MAIVRAIASGNWSNTAIWNTGALPTNADDVYSNTFTVTIDTSPTVLSIQNGSATGVTSGGWFVPTNGMTLTCTGAGLVPDQLASANSNLLVSAISAGQSCSIIANVTSGYNVPAARHGIIHNGSGTVNITGNCSGTNAYSQQQSAAVYNAGAGTINITGNVSAGGGNAVGVINASYGVVNVTGSIVAYSDVGAINNSSGTLTHIGSAQASTSKAAIGGGTTVSQITILTGPLISSDGSGGTAAASGVNPCVALRWFPADTALSTFEYRMRGQTVSGSPSIRPARQLFLTDAYASGYPTAGNVRSSTTYGPGNIYTGTAAIPPAGSVALGVPVDNTTGTAVLTQANFQAALDAQGLTSSRAAKLDNLDTTVSSRLATSGYTAPPTSAQNASAVRTELSTELARIDSTVSSRLASSSYSAPLDAAGTRTAMGLASANLDTQFNNIPGNVRTNLSTELGRIDTTVSSRLASASYTAPPSPEQNATAVRTELSTELGRIDVATGTRSTFNPTTDTVANVALVDTTTNLTNPPVVPTTAEIADAVRIELTPELDRIDTSVSSRLASVDYTVPPTALQNAQAVETQLSLPLGNLDVAISTRSTFNPATDTVAHVTLVDTTTDLTNPPVVPTPEQIATAVRTELELELERIDVDVSTRLAAVDYVEPPTPEANAEAVRVELTPELERVANCATVATTGQQIQNALSL